MVYADIECMINKATNIHTPVMISCVVIDTIRETYIIKTFSSTACIAMFMEYLRDEVLPWFRGKYGDY